ncbi:MAG: glycosyl hydrolase [Candidatus Saccharibacteria bacterium]|nr:glycosyl hydrolase [Candidatus Saccharibacteria bacterium]
MNDEPDSDIPVIHAGPSKKPRTKKIKLDNASFKKPPMLVFVALFSMAGVYFIVNSLAATSTLTKTWATLSDWSSGTLSSTAITNNAVALATTSNGTSSSTATTPSSTTNLALGKPATASSTNTDGTGTSLPASYATDGNASTRWGSQYSDPQYITVDLGANYSIGEVKLNWETAYASAYIIEVSPDNSTWSTIYRTSTGDGGLDDLTGLSGTGRYIRMYGSVRATGWGYSLYEFQVFGAVSATSGNLAISKPISASSTGSITTGGKGKRVQTQSQPASNANDGNASSRWLSSSNDTQWIYMDLGTARNINEVKLSWDANYAKAYQIQFSNDASSWTSVYSTTGGDGGIDDITSLTGTARYVRLYSTARASTSSGYSLFEIEVYGASTAVTTAYVPNGNIVLGYDGDSGTVSTSPVSWTSIAPTASIPAGTSIAYEARTSSDNANWSAWTSVSDSLLGLPASRYLQLRATLATTDAAATPLLQKLALTYVVTTPDAAPAPTVSFSASPTSVVSGSASTLAWSSTNATSCTATGSWSGSKATAGSASTGAVTANSSYGLSCTGSGGTASANATVTVTAPPAGSTAPSGVDMPTGDVTSGGHTWHQVVKEDFTKNLALGSWTDSGTTTSCPSNADAVQYTGNEGASWTSYPKCYLNTDHVHHYRSDQALSVHDGTLDFWLHSVNGTPTSASPGPVMPDGTRYQTYGRYEVRFKTTSHTMNEFYVAWLLWTRDDTKWTCSESDFPESNLGSTSVNAFAHYNSDTVNCPDTNRSQDAYSKSVDFTGWHTYTQEWMPGKRNYYLDGVLIGSSTNYVYANPERWQLQTEITSSCDSGSTNTCTQDGHLLVDWAVVYSY